LNNPANLVDPDGANPFPWWGVLDFMNWGLTNFTVTVVGPMSPMAWASGGIGTPPFLAGGAKAVPDVLSGVPRVRGSAKPAAAGLRSAAAEGRRPGDAALGSRSGTTGFTRLAAECLSESAVVAALCRRTPKGGGGPWECGGRGP
jgi:hypothetical protein